MFFTMTHKNERGRANIVNWDRPCTTLNYDNLGSHEYTIT